MLPKTTEARALYAAILANPAEDSVRLVFADLLDESGSEFAERAAHIRWAVENPQNSTVCLCRDVRNLPCPTCRMLGDEIASIPALTTRDTSYVLNRGFINEIRCDGVDQIITEMDVPCPHCSEYGHPDPDTGIVECRRCDSTGVVDVDYRPNPWILEEIHNHPIERIVPTELYPIQIGNRWNWMSRSLPSPQSPWFLPKPVWDLVELSVHEGFDNAKWADSELAAKRPIGFVFAAFVKGE